MKVIIDIRIKNIRIKDLCEQDGYITVLKKPKVFTYNGDIWHHLGENLKPHQIVQILCYFLLSFINALISKNTSFFSK